MISLLYKWIYNGSCGCIALAVAACAVMPLSAATADALSYRGGQSCPVGGCHDQQTTCSGSSACSGVTATACLSGPHDINGLSCSADTGLCSNQGCGGADSSCGGR
jgi:hypothetical protein